MVSGHAAPQHLTPIGFTEVKHALTICRLRAPLRKKIAEAVRYVPAYLVAAGPNGRTNSGVQTSWFGAVFITQLCNHAADDLRSCSAPPRVNRRYGASLCIEQKDRHAIGRPNAYGETRLIGNKSVSFALAITQAVGFHDFSGMDLTKRDVPTRAALPRTESMFLPRELGKGQTPVNPFRINCKLLGHLSFGKSMKRTALYRRLGSFAQKGCCDTRQA